MNTAAASAREGKLPVRTKLAYGLGTVAFGIKDQGFSALLMLYYNQVIGLPASWVGAAIMLAMIVDALVDPLIGHLSDSLRSDWGRRHPFMYASALPVAVSYLLLWSPPHAAQTVQFVWLVSIATGVRMAISLFEIPNAALMNEFTTDYDERTSLSTYRAMFFASGMVGFSVITFKWLLPSGADGQVGQLNASGYTHYSQVAAVVMLLCILISSLGTQRYGRSLLTATPAPRLSIIGLWRGLAAVLGDRIFSSVLLCCFFFAVATGMNTALGTYFSTYFWGLSADRLGTLAGAALIGMVLAPPTVMLTRRFGKKGVATTLFLLALVSCTAPVFLVLVFKLSIDPATFMPYLIGQNVLTVLCMLAGLILLTSMVADVGEHFQLKTGTRMEGLMFAALIMLNKAVSGMGVFTAGLVLSAIHFPDHAKPGAVSPAIVHHLGWIYIVGMSVLLLLAIVCLSFYPITRDAHRQMVEQLERA